ncbi:DUF4174 domain-containing protein [Winogradskyella alexanderae]|uniref:DUF4174 domain-containing protein n=1 Tax=Winogradskyella alexanderae TaxID=2877123 RepID=A0ABS7XUS7_9FLAO|nr:DUF4174 domain-containing protein [Winogradskyella alexanderae]MCA0132581.1 DUF4174 domain-containing protein [Winogradskyella alexanderae]
MQLKAQNLDDYKWKNRIVLIISTDENSEDLIEQNKLLETDKEGLKERRLLLINVLPTKYKLHAHKWESGSKLYDLYNAKKASFKIILIGLDGGVKLEQMTPLKKQGLFDIIDTMPMRRAELRDKN